MLVETRKNCARNLLGLGQQTLNNMSQVCTQMPSKAWNQCCQVTLI